VNEKYVFQTKTQKPLNGTF